MNIEQFNQLNDEQAQTVLAQCVHIESWSKHLAQQRPYHSAEDLYHTATELAQHWTWTEVKLALDQHPRIGERQAKGNLSEKEQNFSNNEQSSLGLTDNTQQQLYEGNVAYEQRFNHIFLIRAKGRTAENILSELHRRLNNDVATEQREVCEQLAQIALLRLQQEITV